MATHTHTQLRLAPPSPITNPNNLPIHFHPPPPHLPSAQQPATSQPLLPLLVPHHPLNQPNPHHSTLLPTPLPPPKHLLRPTITPQRTRPRLLLQTRPRNLLLPMPRRPHQRLLAQRLLKKALPYRKPFRALRAHTRRIDLGDGGAEGDAEEEIDVFGEEDGQ